MTKSWEGAGRTLPPYNVTPSDKAASRGEPSYVWRSGQERRLEMIRAWVDLEDALVLDSGCGLGAYLSAFGRFTPRTFGHDVEHDRLVQALPTAAGIVEAVGEHLPFAAGTFDFVFSNEVIEHVQDDAAYAAELVRVTRPGGRVLIFCPNRWYPVEQHGIYWRGRYKFGNIPLVNYLPDAMRDRLAPHVRTYTRRKLLRLFEPLPVRRLCAGRIYGGYDNIAYRWPRLGRWLKQALYTAEKTPLSVFGLSHLIVLEKTD